MGGFNIKRGPSEFQIPEDSFESYMSQQERMDYISVTAEPQMNGAVPTLYILPSAFSEIDKHIGWKISTPANIKEQGGILVGNVYKERESQSICGVVRHVIPSANAGNPTYIQFSHKDWILMYKEFEERFSISNEREQPMCIIGWYHTHPNMPVRMSTIDKQTHVGFFGKDNQFSVIFNPQRGIWAVFNGIECRNCNGTLFCNPDERNNSDGRDSDEGMIERHPVAQTHNNAFVIKKRSSFYESGRQWNNYISINGSRYYYPLNIRQIDAETAYIISGELIEKFSSCIVNWDFLSNESVSSVYYINQESLRSAYGGCTDPRRYILLEGDMSLDADGIIFNDGREGFLKYLGMPQQNDVGLAVVYSSTRLSFEYLKEVYGEYECILWINPKIRNEFGFYMSSPNSRLRKDKFIIKDSDQSNMERIGLIYIRKFASNIFEELINVPCTWNNRDYLIAEYDDPNYNGRLLLISKRVLDVLIQKIEGYGKIRHEFSMIISFMSPKHLYEGQIVADPLGNCFILMQIFSKDDIGKTRSASLKCSSDTTRNGSLKTDKFAVIISNRDIDIGEYQYKLANYLGAVCLNVETRKYRFHCLS